MMILCRITASASNGSPYLSKITSAMAQLTWPVLGMASLFGAFVSVQVLVGEARQAQTEIAAATQWIETHLLVAVSAVRAVASRIDIAHRADLV